MTEPAGRTTDVTRRARRSTEEIRALILSAARDRFAALGYAGATTREIAGRADVSEYLLFKHFGSKAELFDAAVAAPFRTAVDDFASRWGPGAGRRPDASEAARDFADRLFDLLSGRRDLILALLRSEHRESPQGGDEPRPLVPLMERLEVVGAHELAALGHGVGDPALAVRCVFGMVAFAAAFMDELYAADVDRPERERIVEQVTELIVGGLTRR